MVWYERLEDGSHLCLDKEGSRALLLITGLLVCQKGRLIWFVGGWRRLTVMVVLGSIHERVKGCLGWRWSLQWLGLV